MKILAGLLALTVFILVGCSSSEVGRQRVLLTKDWAFALGDSTRCPSLSYSLDGWRRLDLPHDWAIEGDFSEQNPSGVDGGALPGGIGWYVKDIDVSDADLQGRVVLEFEGAYMNSTVYVNGIKRGTRPYGYSSFAYDVTSMLHTGTNRIAVRVDNADQPNSRWYSGCGIYRNVWLLKTNNVHVARWGTYVTTPLINKTRAKVAIATTVRNDDMLRASISLRQTVYSPEGAQLAVIMSKKVVDAESEETVTESLDIHEPQLWDIDSPKQYSVVTEVLSKGELIDVYTTKFGIRSFYFDADHGFMLNDSIVKINGVCQHHDLGCLGAAVNRRAIERQLQILKNMGCNAIRCSHNPPATELLDLCDSMGFIVMDEAFDMWRKAKTKYDYSRYFAQWYEYDLRDMIMRDRNHPSIMMWSIGNEVREQWTQDDTKELDLETVNLILNKRRDESDLAKGQDVSVNALLCRELASIVRSLDKSRPILTANNEPRPDNHLFKSGALDIIGYNYALPWYEKVPQNFPNKPFIISESVSGLMTRGYYKMPSTQEYVWPERSAKSAVPDASLSCSSYDNCRVPWGSTHEQTWVWVKNCKYISGQFIWTGFDYLGEPTPYRWPARSSYFGIVDLAGFPKDVYYMYQSEWTDKTMIHLFPHWNWKDGQEIDMWCYYNNADEVELFVNGQSQGVSRKDSTRFHAMWRVNFRPGTVKAVSKRNGKVVAEQVIKTAGRPYKVRLSPDRNRIKNDGVDLSFVTVEIVDEDGNLCPNAENLVEFKVEGTGFIAGVDNGSPISMERFKDNKRKAFYGKCLVVLQNGGETGNIRLTATSEGLKPADLVIHCLPADKIY